MASKAEELAPPNVVWAKSARGTWSLGHTFGDELCFTRDILD